MKTAHHILTGQAKVNAAELSPMRRVLAQVSKLSEPFWLCLSFGLFLIMGPFSIIAVLYGVWSLASEENRQKMVEPANC
ncbi:MAG: hypothetical protein C4563_00355 [Desulfobulbus sp.]|nr:MAG: hypothetical protein C4563_00355 [Desulfobulbus sp.]